MFYNKNIKYAIYSLQITRKLDLMFFNPFIMVELEKSLTNCIKISYFFKIKLKVKKKSIQNRFDLKLKLNQKDY
jgi:hypothetical protein